MTAVVREQPLGETDAKTVGKDWRRRGQDGSRSSNYPLTGASNGNQRCGID